MSNEYPRKVTSLAGERWQGASGATYETFRAALESAETERPPPFGEPLDIENSPSNEPIGGLPSRPARTRRAAMSDDEWYWTVGNIIGGIAAVIAFIGGWIYCTAIYGFLFGFGLGWLPSAILAGITFFAVKVLWGLAALAIIVAVVLSLRS